MRFRIQTILGTSLILILILILLYNNNLREQDPTLKLIFNSIEIPFGGFCMLLICFEFVRPNFKITDKEITFSNYPIWSLLFKKNFLNIVQISDIKDIFYLKDRMLIIMKNGRKDFIIKQFQFDDYETISKIIIKRFRPNISLL